MSYIGNQVTSVPYVVDSFAGDAVTSTFGPLVRAPAGTASIAVFINGAYKTPGADYSLSGEYITFVSAPASGATIIVHHLGNGTTTQVPSDGSVTGTKLAVNAIRANNIVAGQITGNLIAPTSISTNHYTLNSITTNLIATQAVSGNQIGLGAISANNLAFGGITSNVLASNLTVSVARVNEIVNVVTGAIQGNYNVHVSNTSVYYFVANTTGNVTFNLIANDASATGTTGRVNDLIKVGESVSVALMLKQGSTRYRANVYVDGVLQTAYWLANSQPSYGTSLDQSIDTYNFIIVKTAETAHPGAFTVFAANTPYGMANGQGMGVAGGQ